MSQVVSEIPQADVSLKISLVLLSPFSALPSSAPSGALPTSRPSPHPHIQLKHYTLPTSPLTYSVTYFLIDHYSVPSDGALGTAPPPPLPSNSLLRQNCSGSAGTVLVIDGAQVSDDLDGPSDGDGDDNADGDQGRCERWGVAIRECVSVLLGSSSGVGGKSRKKKKEGATTAAAAAAAGTEG